MENKMKHIIVGVNIDAKSPAQVAKLLKDIADMIEEDGWEGSNVYETEENGSTAKANVIRERIKKQVKNETRVS